MTSTNKPKWISAPFNTFEENEQNIILEFCDVMNLHCTCDTKKRLYFKYCNLCLNILLNLDSSIIEINKTEIISVKNVLKYYNHMNKNKMH